MVTRYEVAKQADIFIKWDDGETRRICSLKLLINTEAEAKLTQGNMNTIKRKLGWEIIREGFRILVYKSAFAETK